MAKSGRSFFERLTGTVNVDDYDEEEILDEDPPEPHRISPQPQGRKMRLEPETPAAAQHNREVQHRDQQEWIEEENEEEQLTVDVYNSPDDINIKAIVAGVKPEDLDISITRDMVVIRGKREEIKPRQVSDEDYYYRELYWGSFSRTILLPQEVEVEQAEASEKYGLLSIRLPKINKEKQTKLKVKAG